VNRDYRQRTLSFDAQRGCQGPIKFTNLRLTESANKISEGDFSNADQFITVDGTLMLKTLIDTHGYLGRQAIVCGIDGSADDGGEI